MTICPAGIVETMDSARFELILLWRVTLVFKAESAIFKVVFWRIVDELAFEMHEIFALVRFNLFTCAIGRRWPKIEDPLLGRRNDIVLASVLLDVVDGMEGHQFGDLQYLGWSYARIQEAELTTTTCGLETVST